MIELNIYNSAGLLYTCIHTHYTHTHPYFYTPYSVIVCIWIILQLCFGLWFCKSLNSQMGQLFSLGGITFVIICFFAFVKSKSADQIHCWFYYSFATDIFLTANKFYLSYEYDCSFDPPTFSRRRKILKTQIEKWKTTFSCYRESIMYQ